jgi:hypothetical protein
MTAALTCLGFGCLLLLCGGVSFSLMFQDITPSQNTYAWPFLFCAGLFFTAFGLLGVLGAWLF